MMRSALRAVGSETEAREPFCKRSPGPPDIGFHLCKRHVQLACDLHIGHAFEMVKHERHALMLRQFLQRLINQLPALIGFNIGNRGIWYRKVELRPITFRRLCAQFGEKSPPPPIPRQMIKRESRGDGFEPATGRWTRAQLREALMSFEKYLLRNVFGAHVVADEACGG